MTATRFRAAAIPICRIRCSTIQAARVFSYLGCRTAAAINSHFAFPRGLSRRQPHGKTPPQRVTAFFKIMPRRGCNPFRRRGELGRNWVRRFDSAPPRELFTNKNRKIMENQKIRIVKKGIERKFSSKNAKLSAIHGCVVEACGELMYLNEVVMIPGFLGLEVVAHAIWVHGETGTALSMLIRLRDGDSLWAGEIVDEKGKRIFDLKIQKYL